MSSEGIEKTGARGKKLIQQFVVLVLVIPMLGCMSKFQEAHYFKSQSASDSEIPNYYRLTVSGFSFLSNSRYVSGYFDKDTLDTYFNEYTQPVGAAILPRTGASKAAASGGQGAGEGVEPVAKELEGKKIIMILSSNSDEVATQIGALAASKQFVSSLSGLVARDRFAAADTAESRLATEKTRAITTASLAMQVVNGLSDTATKDEAEEALMTFVNVLASDLGHEGVFTTLEDAAEWLKFNRARLLGGGQ